MESKKRTIIRAISYRALVSAILAMLSWTFTGNAGQTTIITVAYAILATIGYYGHERIWNKISWETKKVPIMNASASD
jgi:uncharacterized membrane protein